MFESFINKTMSIEDLIKRQQCCEKYFNVLFRNDELKLLKLVECPKINYNLDINEIEKMFIGCNGENILEKEKFEMFMKEILKKEKLTPNEENIFNMI